MTRYKNKPNTLMHREIIDDEEDLLMEVFYWDIDEGGPMPFSNTDRYWQTAQSLERKGLIRYNHAKQEASLTQDGIREALRIHGPRWDNPLNRMVVTAGSEDEARARASKFGRIVGIDPHSEPGKYYVLVDQKTAWNPGAPPVATPKLKAKLLR